jgi:hypothetical protein
MSGASVTSTQLARYLLQQNNKCRPVRRETDDANPRSVNNSRGWHRFFVVLG